MAWFGSGESVAELMAKGKYQKAVELIEKQLDQDAGNPRLRLQLADALVQSGRKADAVPVLIEAADIYASNGEAPKAIAALKKIERIAPGRRDVESKLASLIRKKTGAPAATPQFLEPAGSTFDEAHFARVTDPGYTDAERIAAAKGATWVPSTRQEPNEPAAIPMLEVSADPEPKDAAAAAPAGAAGSPLFGSFSQDELIAVMQGLRLLSFEPGDIIISEGDAGDSLFVIASGIAKAFVRKDGRQTLARSMDEGTFFGEISILSGKPRTATVTAATSCELLELDRATLDGITKAQPNVRRVLEDFYVQRAGG